MDILKKVVAAKHQAEFARSFFDMVNHFPDTDRIFNLMDLLREQADPEAGKKMAAAVAQNPAIKDYLEEHYLPPKYGVDDLADARPGTVRYAYYRHMHDNGFSTDFFPPLDPSDPMKYISLRMRQTHDIWHVLTGCGSDAPGEIGLQAFYTAQLGAPNTVVITAGALLASASKPETIKAMFEEIVLGWQAGLAAKPLYTVNWEKLWDRNLNEVRREYNIQPVSARFDFEPAVATA